ncbi:EpsI family protein [candidate division KSB1 bacterium]|nr:EpsI family protein [candidate division KSB1 bacterium]
MNFRTKEFWIVISLLLIAGVYSYVLRYSRVSANEVVQLESFPRQIDSWKMSHTYFMDDKTLDVLKSDQYIWRVYNDDQNNSVNLLITYFNDQKYGAQIHSPKHCLPGGGWKILNKEENSINVNNELIHVNKMIIGNSRTKELMIYWFWTRSGIITSELGLKADLAKNALFRKPTDAAFIRINTTYNDGNFQDDKVILFIDKILPLIDQILPFKKI